jgi:hypothetical protein
LASFIKGQQSNQNAKHQRFDLKDGKRFQSHVIFKRTAEPDGAKAVTYG